MMNRQADKTRVLIADDSKFMRHLVGQLLEEEDDIRVVGEASDGYEAVKKASKLLPDVIIMDYNMPEIHGMGAAEIILDRIQKNPPKIIMLSAYSEGAIIGSFKALEKGVIAFVRKPSGELSLDIEKVKNELLRMIRTVSRAKVVTEEKIIKLKNARLLVGETDLKTDLVVIGASTGGPPVVEKIVAGLPADFQAAVLVVQHMPVGFTEGFASYIDRGSKINVAEARAGDEVLPGHCLIAPSGRHMVIKERKGKRFVSLKGGKRISGYRPSIDVLLESISELSSHHCLAVILTGMGHDGQNGVKKIVESGGYAIAQSPETATIETMPFSIINNNLANEILSPHLIIDRIKELV